MPGQPGKRSRIAGTGRQHLGSSQSRRRSFDKAKKGDVVSLLFLPKTRFGYREGNEPGEARPRVIINLPAAAPSVEQYAHGVTIEASPSPAPNLPDHVIRG